MLANHMLASRLIDLNTKIFLLKLVIKSCYLPNEVSLEYRKICFFLQGLNIFKANVNLFYLNTK